MVYACEIKFSQHPLGSEVITEIEDRSNRLSLPRGFAFSNVLIHVNGVSNIVQNHNSLFATIDFLELLDHVD